MTLSCRDTSARLCETLQDDLLNFKVQAVKDLLDNWLVTLEPEPTIDDPTGHWNNLIYFVNRLNEECDLGAGMNCYQCIKTFPAQTEIIVQVVAIGGNVQRVIDIRTPASDIMTIVNVHE